MANTVICEECGRPFKNRAGLVVHTKFEHAETQLTKGESQQSLNPNINKTEVKCQVATFDELRKMFEDKQQGVFAPPQTEEQVKVAGLDNTRKSIVQTMQVLIEVSALLHPEKLDALLAEFSDEPQFKQLLMLDWLDWVYRSYGQVHVLEDMMVKALKKQCVDTGILAEGEELPETPKTKLGPVLDQLAQRINR